MKNDEPLKFHYLNSVVARMLVQKLELFGNDNYR